MRCSWRQGHQAGTNGGFLSSLFAPVTPRLDRGVRASAGAVVASVGMDAAVKPRHDRRRWVGARSATGASFFVWIIGRGPSRSQRSREELPPPIDDEKVRRTNRPAVVDRDSRARRDVAWSSGAQSDPEKAGSDGGSLLEALLVHAFPGVVLLPLGTLVRLLGRLGVTLGPRRHPMRCCAGHIRTSSLPVPAPGKVRLSWLPSRPMLRSAAPAAMARAHGRSAAQTSCTLK